jgi:hypothetical protein
MRVAHRIESYATFARLFSHLQTRECVNATTADPSASDRWDRARSPDGEDAAPNSRAPDYAHAAPRHLDEKALGRNSRANRDTECLVEAQD